MKELNKLIIRYGELYSHAVIYILFVIASLTVSVILFGILHSTGIMKLAFANAIEQAEFGGAFAGFLATLIFLIKSYNKATKETKLIITGNVLNADTTPVKDALVFVDGVDRQKETDTTGWFTIEVNEQESWVVRASYDEKTAHETVTRDNIRNPVKLVLTDSGVLTKQISSQRDLVLNVSVNGEPTKDAIRDHFDSSNSETLVYQITNIGSELHIDPKMGYLSKLADGGPISGLDYWWSPFEWRFPQLDLKIVNNTKKTVFFTDAVFEVDKSVLDPFPILVIKESMYNVFHFKLLNEGWGDIQNCLIKFNIVSQSELVTFEKPYRHQADVGNFTEEYNVDISDALSMLGVDAHILREGTREALGPFKEGVVLVFGEITFSGMTVEGSLKTSNIKFSTYVSLIYPGPGAPAPSTYQYEAMLEVGKNNYEIRVPISQVLKQGETDRFSILIGAQKSSIHIFRLKLIYDNNQNLVSPIIVLKIFLPRSQVDMLRKVTKHND